ncbi:MAG TPA: 2-amino-4-hydroxy-6-hydroxymethyldihydropteridine diphosphokinase [Geobacteraceae bacterium]|nr:2-amino-4-hydroxy-6-hydroxymethyldihydropteridine diphosphokinase [Geobacteraceae bacterium]
MESSAYIALGSNLGDRELNMLRGIAEIGKLPGTRITALSGFYDTQPVGPVEQDNFLNAALRIETSLSPHQLLSELQRIETETFGRKRTVRWGPRSIDLDILFYGNLVIAGEDLTIPHPCLHERRFVLAPLVEIAPGLVHPGIGRSLAEILDDLAGDERVEKI